MDQKTIVVWTSSLVMFKRVWFLSSVNGNPYLISEPSEGAKRGRKQSSRLTTGQELKVESRGGNASNLQKNAKKLKKSHVDWSRERVGPKMRERKLGYPLH